MCTLYRKFIAYVVIIVILALLLKELTIKFGLVLYSLSLSFFENHMSSAEKRQHYNLSA